MNHLNLLNLVNLPPSPPPACSGLTRRSPPFLSSSFCSPAPFLPPLLLLSAPLAAPFAPRPPRPSQVLLLLLDDEALIGVVLELFTRAAAELLGAFDASLRSRDRKIRLYKKNNVIPLWSGLKEGKFSPYQRT